MKKMSSRETKDLLLNSQAMSNEKQFTDPSYAAEFELIRQSLLAQKSDILNRDSEFKKDQEAVSKFSDEADQTAQELQNNVRIHLHERERISLVLIEKTLAKFANLSFGKCESCSDFISLNRLKARPLATLCISCMEDVESSNSRNKQGPILFQ